MADNQPPRKVGRPQSEYKTHFSPVVSEGVTKWQCNFCGMQYGPRTGTANLKRHLTNYHPQCFRGSVLAPHLSEEFQRNGYARVSNDPPVAFYTNSGNLPFYTSNGCMPSTPNVCTSQSSVLMSAQSPCPEFMFHQQAQPRALVRPPPQLTLFSSQTDPSSAVLTIAPECNGRPFPASNSWPPTLASANTMPSWGGQYVGSLQPERITTDAYGHQWLQKPESTENDQQDSGRISSSPLQIQEQPRGTPDMGRHQWMPNLASAQSVSYSPHIQNSPDPNPSSDNRGNIGGTLGRGQLQWLQPLARSESDQNSGRASTSPLQIREQPGGTTEIDRHQWMQNLASPTSVQEIKSSSPHVQNSPSSNPCNENLGKLRGTLDNGHLQWLHPSTSSSYDQRTVHNVGFPDPSNENRGLLDTGHPGTVDVSRLGIGRKRKQSRDMDVVDLEVFTIAKIEALIRDGFSKIEILEKMLNMTVSNPMYLQAFLNDNMQDFFTIVHPHFPDLSLSLIDDELLHRKREALKSLLKEYCDTRWSPLLFDVFVFPLLLGERDLYAIVELVFLDKKGHRRSCLLDCVPLPDQFPAEILCGIIAANLRAFEVDSKLSDCTMWGRKYEAANSVLKAKLECRRRGRADGLWEEEKKKQFFSVLKKSQEEQVYSIQIEVVHCLSCLDQLEEMLNGTLVRPMRGICPNYGVDMMTILSDLQSIFEPSLLQFDSINDSLEWTLTPSINLTEKFLEIVYRKFNTLQRKMNKLSDLGRNLKRNLNQISCDRKYAVYYIQKNRKSVNLLHIIPVTSYEDALKDIHYYLNNFMELLKNPGLDNSYGMSDLVADMDLIEIEDCPELPCNTDTLYEPKSLFENILKIFQDWRKIFQQGVALSNEYISLCNYFTGYKNHESNIQSRYAREFCDVARSAPPHLPPEKWKKVTLLRAWNKFQSDYE